MPAKKRIGTKKVTAKGKIVAKKPARLTKGLFEQHPNLRFLLVVYSACAAIAFVTLSFGHK